MKPAEYDTLSIEVTANSAQHEYLFRVNASALVFKGFLAVLADRKSDAKESTIGLDRLPALSKDDPIELRELFPEQHFTQPPPRYTEATLVKALEELGIGRPSTYASIMGTIVARDYVRLEDRRFFANDVAEIVTDGLVKHFPEVVDTGFTARMEEELDQVAEGDLAGVTVLNDFWGPFSADLERAEDKWERYLEDLDEECPKCLEEGRTPPGRLQQRLGKYGFFIGCSRFSAEDGGCKYIRNLDGEERPEPELLDEI